MLRMVVCRLDGFLILIFLLDNSSAGHDLLTPPIGQREHEGLHAIFPRRQRNSNRNNYKNIAEIKRQSPTLFFGRARTAFFSYMIFFLIF
jgi:hypothetical protein